MSALGPRLRYPEAPIEAGCTRASLALGIIGKWKGPKGQSWRRKVTEITQGIGQAGEESDMLHLQSIFAKAANAIVEASQLRKEVANLQTQMTQLNASFEQLKASNEHLVRELEAIREEKVELQSKLRGAESDNINLKHELTFVYLDRDNLKEKITRLEDSLASARRDIDQYIAWQEEREKEVAKLKGTIEGIQAAHERFTKASQTFAYAGDEFAKAVWPKIEVAEAPPTEWKQAVSTFPEAPVPFESTSGEQPRAEDGKFEPLPMAARHFE